MIQIECPKPAYDKLVKAGLDKRIIKAKKEIIDIHLGSEIYWGEETLTAILDKAEAHLKQVKRLDERYYAYKDVLDLFALTESDNFLVEIKRKH